MADSKFAIPKDPKGLTAWLNKKIADNKNKLPERQMKLNLAFTLGEQWLVWDQDKRQFSRPRLRSDDPNAPIRLTVNKVGGIVEQWISRVLKHQPEPEVLPISDEPDDVDAARVGGRMLESELNRLKWKTLLVDLYFWVAPLGWSFIQIAWAPDDGRLIGNDPDSGAPVHEGEIVLDIVPAPELLIDPNGKKRSLEDAKWAIRTIHMTPEAAYEQWGVELTAEAESRSLAQEVFDLANSSDGKLSAKGQTIKVHQFWLRPGSRMAPKGLVVTWSGDTILEQPVPFPYKHGKLPFVQFDVLPGIGTREGRTFVKDLVPLQADYNDARSREAMLRRTLVPKILSPTGAIDPRRVGTRVEVIQYNPIGAPPKFEIPNSSWMQQYEQTMQRGEQEMEKRSNTETMAFGTRTSAAAIMAMQDAAELQLLIPVNLNAAAVEMVGTHVLSLVRQFWTEDRVVRTWSQDGELEVEHYTGSDIAGELDVRVSTESGLPDSKAGRVQLATELQQLGMLPDPRAFVRLLDMPGMDLISETLDLDTKQQRRETNKLIQGIPVPVNPFDNHVIHLQEINNFRKSKDYENLDPQIRAIVDAHADVHNELVLAQLGMPPGNPNGGPSDPAGGPGGLAGMLGPGGKGAQQQPPQEGGTDREAAIREKAGIGGHAQPGAVPGVSADRQAASMGH